MRKLIIQIPCFNEAAVLPATLHDLPRQVDGFDSVEVLVIDDGSTDGTVDVARENGADHIVQLPGHQGLARAFMTGLDAALRLGADVIVNTDADNQYRGDGIDRLTRPILERRAQMVVGARPVRSEDHFSAVKKLLQALGSWVVRVASNTTIADAPSGFRAFDREAAMRLFVYSAYTYTLETIIQAGRKGIPIVSVPIETNPPTRPSRLVRSNLQYVTRSMATIVRLLILYKPLRLFVALAVVCAAIAGLIGARFLYFFISEGGAGHIQSLLVAVVLSIVAALLAVVGVICDLVAANRQMLEDIRYRLMRQEIDNHRQARHPAAVSQAASTVGAGDRGGSGRSH